MTTISPLSIRTVLFAMDGSSASRRAFLLANEIASHCASTLLVADIASMKERQDPEYEHLLAIVEEQIRSRVGTYDIQKVPLGPVITPGSVVASLAAIVSERHVELLVLGTHGWTGIRKIFDGSKAEETMQSLSVPTLTLGPNVRTGLKFKRLLYVTDLSPSESNAIRYVASVARDFGASFDVLHVNDPRREETPHDAAERMPCFVQEQIVNNGLGEVFGMDHLLFGETSEWIIQLANKRDIDLLVLPLKHTNGIRAKIAAHLPGGDLAYNIIARAPCPVLTLHVQHREDTRHAQSAAR